MAEDFDIGGAPPEEPSNRKFVIAAAGIGGLLVLSMICLALYALVLAPAQQRNRASEATDIALQNGSGSVDHPDGGRGQGDAYA